MKDRCFWCLRETEEKIGVSKEITTVLSWMCLECARYGLYKKGYNRGKLIEARDMNRNAVDDEEKLLEYPQFPVRDMSTGDELPTISPLAVDGWCYYFNGVFTLIFMIRWFFFVLLYRVMGWDKQSKRTE